MTAVRVSPAGARLSLAGVGQRFPVGGPARQLMPFTGPEARLGSFYYSTNTPKGWMRAEILILGSPVSNHLIALGRYPGAFLRVKVRTGGEG